MTRCEWVLLQGLLGLLGLLSIAFRVDSASLSALAPTNEENESRVCAYLCKISPSGKPCKAFCTSRRQFTIQSNTVADKKDVVLVVSVEETRRDACPTLCQNGISSEICICDEPQNPDSGSASVSDLRVKVPSGAVKLIPSIRNCEKISCQDNEHRVDDCPECSKGDHHFSSNNNPFEEIHTEIIPPRIPRSLMDEDVTGLVPRGGGAVQKTDAIGERETIDAVVDSLELGRGHGGQRTMLEGPSLQQDVPEFDLEEFCKIQCPKGNGGIVCGCDLLPI